MRLSSFVSFVGSVACLLLTALTSQAQNYSWTTAASGNWNSTGWTSGTPGVGPPPSAANATINVGGSAYTVSVTDARAINNLTLNNASATLAIAPGGSLAVNGTFFLDGGTIDNSGNGLTLNGSLTWTGGIVGPGTMTASNGGSINTWFITGGTANLAAGTFSWTGGALTFNGGNLTIGAGATVSSTTNGGIIVNSGTAVITNNGTLEKVGGTGASQWGSGLTFNNAGTLRVTSGSWRVQGAVVNNTGTIDIGPSGELFLGAGTVNLNAGSVITGTGSIEVNDIPGPVLAVNATVNASTSLSFIRGHINGTGTLNLSGSFHFGVFNAAYILQGITLNAGGGGTWNGTGTPRIGTATLNLTGGTTTWSNQNITFTDSGTFTVGSGAVLTLTADRGFVVEARHCVRQAGSLSYEAGCLSYFAGGGALR
jgi:hypothetical protein